MLWMENLLLKNTTEIMKDYSITISHISNLGLDVHLMVDNIEEYVEDYLPLKPQILTFHIEASKDEKRTRKIIDIIKSSGTRVGIAISPKTDIEEIKKYLNSIHVVLIMTVIPGKGRTKVNSRYSRKNKNFKKIFR